MAEKILIVDDDVDTLRLVGLMLERQGYQVVAATNGSQGLTKAFEERPDLILLDVMMPDMDGYEVTRRLRKNPATTAIPILMFTAKTRMDDKVMGFESGADDYLTKPTHPTELQAHIRDLLARSTSGRSKSAEPEPEEKAGYVVGILAARGGLGVSTLASNLAAALYARSKANVVLAELTPGQGSLAMGLGLSHQNELTDMLQSSAVEITSEKVKSALIAHPLGAKILPASENPRDVDLTARAENMEALVKRLTTSARFVILDLGSGLPTFTQKALSYCAEVILVLEGSEQSLNQTKILLKEILALNIDSKTVFFALNNRQRSDTQVPLAKVQERLKHPVAASLTPALELFSRATGKSTVATVVQPDHIVSQQILKLADAVIKREKEREQAL